VMTSGQTNAPTEAQRASLNWRLTNREKKSIVSNLVTEQNQKSLKRVGEIFESQKK
jgi:hypothetical protein